MKKILNLTLFIAYFLSFSCTNEENKIVESIKQYNTDYFFKKNLNVNIHEIKLQDFKISSNYNDSIINIAVKDKLLNRAIEISGLDVKEFFKSTYKIYFIELAGKDKDFIDYKKSLEKYRYIPFDSKTYNTFYEVHVYEKYTISDKDGNSQNILNDSAYYLLDKQFNFIFKQNRMPFVLKDE
jgi:hypothetical protein